MIYSILRQFSFHFFLVISVYLLISHHGRAHSCSRISKTIHCKQLRFFYSTCKYCLDCTYYFLEFCSYRRAHSSINLFHGLQHANIVFLVLFLLTYLLIYKFLLGRIIMRPNKRCFCCPLEICHSDFFSEKICFLSLLF